MSALRIAVADDERDIRDFLSRMLHHLGHQVICVVENGRQLVDACADSAPDLVITDVRMPVLDGISAAAEILQHHAVPIIVLSARPVEGPIKELHAAPSVVQLVKPVSGTRLQEAIDEALEQRPASSEPLSAVP